MAVWLSLALLAAVLWLALAATFGCIYYRDIARLWREPVLRRPVLVLESDDWGAGPLVQAEALDGLAAVLRQHADFSGRPSVMSLAIVLAVPDPRALAAGAYGRIALDDPPLRPVLEALNRGQSQGSFSLQLHGLEHFWPPTLVASKDPMVQAWLRRPGLARTEDLPAHLQSRWIDAAQLPSRPLTDADVGGAVADEVHAYERVTGNAPTIVVPPTFVWSPAVERAWAARGVKCIVTPGCRYVGRDKGGASIDDGSRFANGDRSGPLTYLVRSDYFEPARGRDAAYALRALERATAEGRPCVLENHRINFCSDLPTREHSLGELHKLLAGALTKWPDVAFLSSADLLRIIGERDERWISGPWRERWPQFLQRLRGTGRLWKLLRWSGVAAALIWTDGHRWPVRVRAHG